MTFGEVFAILNELVAGFNQLRDAVGSSLTGGVLDYNKLGNKPSINSVELVGDRAQSELALEADAATLQAVRDLGAQIDGFTVERQGYVLRLSVVETNRTADVARIATLEGEKTARDNDITAYKTTINTMAQSVQERVNRVESGMQLKADKADTPNTATWINLRTAMDAAVASAEAAVENLARNDDFQEVVTRVRSVINLLNRAVNTIEAGRGQSCSADVLPSDQCTAPISNTFSFDD